MVTADGYSKISDLIKTPRSLFSLHSRANNLRKKTMHQSTVDDEFEGVRILNPGYKAYEFKFELGENLRAVVTRFNNQLYVHIRRYEDGDDYPNHKYPTKEGVCMTRGQWEIFAQLLHDDKWMEDTACRIGCLKKIDGHLFVRRRDNLYVLERSVGSPTEVSLTADSMSNLREATAEINSAVQDMITPVSRYGHRVVKLRQTVRGDGVDDCSPHEFVVLDTGEIFTSFKDDPLKAYESLVAMKKSHGIHVAAKLHVAMIDVVAALCRAMIKTEVKQSCEGCVIDDPSQKHHSCLSQDWDFSVGYRFRNVLKRLPSSLVIPCYFKWINESGLREVSSPESRFRYVVEKRAGEIMRLVEQNETFSDESINELFLNMSELKFIRMEDMV